MASQPETQELTSTQTPELMDDGFLPIAHMAMILEEEGLEKVEEKSAAKAAPKAATTAKGATTAKNAAAKPADWNAPEVGTKPDDIDEMQWAIATTKGQQDAMGLNPKINDLTKKAPKSSSRLLARSTRAGRVASS